jgi:uncharacterized protein (DUF2164 family)
MVQINRNWDVITKEKRKQSINEIIEFFNNERNEKIGMIAAEEILDFFLHTLSIDAYNKGINDSINHLKDLFEDIKIDMETLLKK